jgi:hypothetical protein
MVRGLASKGCGDECANAIHAKCPQGRGRWGAYVVHGNAVGYPAPSEGPIPAIDAPLDAGATVVAEMHAKRSGDCASGATAAERDTWFADLFRGRQGACSQGRRCRLAQREVDRASDGQLSAMRHVHEGNGARGVPRLDVVRKDDDVRVPQRDRGHERGARVEAARSKRQKPRRGVLPVVRSLRRRRSDDVAQGAGDVPWSVASGRGVRPFSFAGGR